MKGKVLNLIIFLLAISCFVISYKLFWNIAVYVDEVNISPDVVLGGDFWLIMEWVKMGFLALITILSGIKLFQKQR